MNSEEYGSIHYESVNLMATLEKECVAEITGKGPLSETTDQPEDPQVHEKSRTSQETT